MAKKVLVHMTDDLDPSGNTEAHRTLEFSFDGTEYEIDLHDDNVKRFKEMLAPYVEAAKAKPAPRKHKPRSTQARTHSQEVRRWAREHGHQVSDKGRISAEAVSAYAAAH